MSSDGNLECSQSFWVWTLNPAAQFGPVWVSPQAPLMVHTCSASCFTVCVLEFNLKRGCECLHSHKPIRRIPADPRDPFPPPISTLTSFNHTQTHTHFVYTKFYHISSLVGVPWWLVNFDLCPCGLIPSVCLPYSVSISLPLIGFCDTQLQW